MIVVYIFNCFLIGTSAALSVNQRENKEKDFDLTKIGRIENEIEREKTKEYWNSKAVETLKEKLAQRLNTNTAKNVIFFLGDGMSFPTIAATRIYLGGEEKQLSFEKFPFAGISKTYCVDAQTADSACSVTAYLGGVKANMATIGVTAAVEIYNCTAMNNVSNHVPSIARLFQLNGKKTGLVTTSKVTDASAAGIYSHTAYRRWESDTDVMKHRKDPKKCKDVAQQLIFGETGKNLRLILGGGRKKFLPKQEIDPENQYGDRSDNVNLIKEWKKMKDGVKHEYIWNRDELLNVKNGTEYLLGLFEADHMKYNLERNKTLDPSLEEMTETALNLLQKQNDNGFFLFIEGGRIDHGHHATTAHKAIDETAEFSKAVQKAVELTDERETLIIATADHAHTMSISGYAKRGSDVLGYAGKANDLDFYTILNYANGPGYKLTNENGDRYVPTEEELNDINFQWPSNSPMESETHGGEDVAIYAKGPWAHLFSGVMEQNVIPHLIAYASCINSENNCHKSKES